MEKTPKNVTVQVGDELAAKMQKLPDVNWSHVVRDCLDRYCNIRLNPDIEALAQKMKGQKEEAYSEGYRAALEWFKREDIRYEDVNEIVRERDSVESDFDENIKEEYGDWQTAQAQGANINAMWVAAERRFWTRRIKKILRELPADYNVTDAFIKGFKTALKKLERLS